MQYTTSLTLALSVSLAALAAPLTAQVGGSLNRGVPTVTAGIQFNNKASVTVKYKAIAFGEGAWQSVLKNVGQHKRHNRNAARSPIGHVVTNSDIKASGRSIPAGEYSMFFTVHEGAGWVVNFKNTKDQDAKPVQFRMAMSQSKTKRDRFYLGLVPAKSGAKANLTFAFGSQTVTVPIELVEAAPTVNASAKSTGGVVGRWVVDVGPTIAEIGKDMPEEQRAMMGTMLKGMFEKTSYTLKADSTYTMKSQMTMFGETQHQAEAGTWTLEGSKVTLTKTHENSKKLSTPQTETGVFKDGKIQITVSAQGKPMTIFLKK